MEPAALDQAADQSPDPARPQWILPAIALLEGESSALELLPDGTLLAANRQGDGKGGLYTLRLKPQGSSFQITPQQEVWRGGAVMALTQDADGTVFFADWGDTVNAFSHSAVRRLTWPAVPAPPAKAAALLPRLPDMAVRELKALLGHPSPRVRLRARQRLEGMSFQDSLEALLQVARRSPSLPARLHGLRGAAAVAGQDQALLNELTAFLGDPEPALRAAAATLLGEKMNSETPPALLRALTDVALPVRLAAAAAVAQRRPPDMAGGLLEAAGANPGRDPLIRSSLAHAMAASVPTATLAASARNHSSAEARLTAVVALRRTAARELGEFLTDPDAVVATEAARAVYDLPVRPLFPALAALLDPAAPLPEALARRALGAAWYLGTAAGAAQTAAFAQSTAPPSPVRLLALDLLEAWDRPDGPEVVWNRPAHPLPRLPGQALTALQSAAANLRQDRDPMVAGKAAALAAQAGPPRPPSQWLAVLTNPRSPLPERLAALLVVQQGHELSAEAARALTLPAEPPGLRAEVRSLLMQRDPKTAVTLTQEAMATGTTAEKQLALRTLDRLPGNVSGSEKFLLELVRQLGPGLVERGLQVEVLEALQRRDVESRSLWRKATETWMASLSLNTDPLAAWRMTVEDGDPAAGRVVFETHPEADCTSCHSLHGEGGLQGPDLDGVAGRLTAGELLESLVLPSARFAKGYQPAAANPPDASGDAALSPMPPAGTILTLRELRDLMAYLKTLKTS